MRVGGALRVTVPTDDVLALGYNWSMAVTRHRSALPRSWIVGSMMDMFMMDTAWTGATEKHAMYIDMQTIAGLGTPVPVGTDRLGRMWKRFSGNVPGLRDDNLTYVGIVHQINHYFVACMHFGSNALHIYGNSVAASRDTVKKLGSSVPDDVQTVLRVWKHLSLALCPSLRGSPPSVTWLVNWEQVRFDGQRSDVPDSSAERGRLRAAGVQRRTAMHLPRHVGPQQWDAASGASQIPH